MAVTLHRHDLPDGLDLGPVVAIDTETMGLDPRRDRLCLVQLSAGDGNAHLVQVARDAAPAPNLTRMLADPAVEKLFHFGRFDIAVLGQAFGVFAAPVWCTKIASKLVRTFTDRHGLKYLLQDLVGVDVSKQQLIGNLQHDNPVVTVQLLSGHGGLHPVDDDADLIRMGGDVVVPRGVLRRAVGGAPVGGR